MKFAIVEGKRREAQPDLPGKCPDCSAAMIAKCGEVRDWHWAHWRARDCDRWSEPETEWHRAWKNHFPESWQEISHTSENGEKHRADVKTDRGVVLEFQHSHLHRDERESREMFYKEMIWVVDGLRLKRDRARFFAALDAAIVVKPKPLTFSFPSNESALLRDWTASRVPVFFDFGDLSEPSDTLFDKPILWRLNPRSSNGKVYLSPVLKTSFLDTHRKGLPLKGFDWSAAVERARSLLARSLLAHSFMHRAPRSGAAIGFDRYLARKEKQRRRF